MTRCAEHKIFFQYKIIAHRHIKLSLSFCYYGEKRLVCVLYHEMCSWTRKAGPKSYFSCCCCCCFCCYQFSKDAKIPEAFLIRTGAQRNFAHAFMLTLPTDLPSQVFHLLSN